MDFYHELYWLLFPSHIKGTLLMFLKLFVLHSIASVVAFKTSTTKFTLMMWFTERTGFQLWKKGDEPEVVVEWFDGNNTKYWHVGSNYHAQGKCTQSVRRNVWERTKAEYKHCKIFLYSLCFYINLFLIAFFLVRFVTLSTDVLYFFKVSDGIKFF